MSRPIDDNWHYIDGKRVYKIPVTVIDNFETDEETRSVEELTLCEDCFEALLDLLKDYWRRT